MEEPKTTKDLDKWASETLFKHCDKQTYIDVISAEIEKKAIVKSCLEKGMTPTEIENEYPNIKFSNNDY